MLEKHVGKIKKLLEVVGKLLDGVRSYWKGVGYWKSVRKC